MMDDLIIWLRAQLDEDERLANEQREFDAMVEAQRDPGAVNAILMPPLALPGAPGDPDRALAEVEAKRVIIAAYEASVRSVGAGLSRDKERLVVAIAQPYAGQPGWREQWRA